ncbi:S8 family serine peptidase [Haliangium sp.]|uniref:S8 family serine peptidase n=1 Tax=Haliangium sp. TaxID=2663208 RepID=UPI003D0FAC65
MNRMIRRYSIGALITLTLGLAQQAAASEFLVKYDGNQMPAELAAEVNDLGGGYRALPEIGYAVVWGLTDSDAEQLMARPEVVGVTLDLDVQWLPGVEVVGAFSDTELRATAGQGDAAFFDHYQWYLRQIEADDAWDVTAQGSGTLVCVLDTGVDPTHQDLVGRVDLSKSVSFVPDEPFIEDLNFHGTFVSALIASNGIGMGSVAPQTNLCAIKVLGASGSGSFGDVISGIVHAANVDADVMNLSLGALIPRDSADVDELIDALQEAVDYAHRSGTLVVAASGNDGVNLDENTDLIHVPSMLRNVLSVGATAPINQQDFDTLTTYSNFGLRGVDVVAPGGDFIEGGVVEDLILSACSSFVCGEDGVYVLAAGTSFASPLTAATAAVAAAEAHHHGHHHGHGGHCGGHGGVSARKLSKCVEKGADRLTHRFRDPQFGRGRINVLGAVSECSH